MIGQGDERNRRWCAGRQRNTSQRDETTRGLKTPMNDQTVVLPHSASILGGGSWCPFWFNHIFCSMIFGQVMDKIRHGGGSFMVVFQPFWEVVGVVCLE